MGDERSEECRDLNNRHMDEICHELLQRLGSFGDGPAAGGRADLPNSVLCGVVGELARGIGSSAI
jgi:hypothetical protein